MGSMSNMLRSLLVVGFFLLALVAIVPRMSEVERPAVDACGQGLHGRHADELADRDADGPRLRLGADDGQLDRPGTDKVATFTTVWKTPAGGDLAVQAGRGSHQHLVVDVGGRQPPAGTVRLGGRTVERYAGGRTSQVGYVVRPAASGGVTLVATTNASEDELAAFVAALEPVTLPAQPHHRRTPPPAHANCRLIRSLIGSARLTADQSAFTVVGATVTAD